MLKSYIESVSDWNEPTPGNVVTFLLATLSGGVWVATLFPPYTMFSTIWLIAVPLFWLAVVCLVKFAPVRKVIDAERTKQKRVSDLSYYARSAYRTYQGLPNEVKVEVPTLTLDNIEGMTDKEACELYYALENLKNTYDEQQRLLSYPQNKQLIESVKDLAESLDNQNTLLKELA